VGLFLFARISPPRTLRSAASADGSHALKQTGETMKRVAVIASVVVAMALPLPSLALADGPPAGK
jgi:hypothetical protein